MPKKSSRRKPRYGSNFTVVLISIVISSVFTFIISSIMLYFKVDQNSIIYSLIPIWIGIAAISYLAQTEG